MQLCKIADAAPGMKLARPIRNAEGAVLCPAGFILTDVVIARLEKSGIGTFFLEGGEDTGPTPEERIAKLETRFAEITQPALIHVKEVVKKYFAAASAERGGATQSGTG